MNVELASPAHFIPELPGWAERSPFVSQSGLLGCYHHDFYAQALAKLERGHAQDVIDVREMRNRGLVELPRLLDLFEQIEPLLFRYPAIDPASFSRSVREFAAGTTA